MYSVHRENGTLKWKYDTGGAIYGSPVIGRKGEIYVGSGNSTVCVNSDGSRLWAFATGGLVATRPAIAPDGQTVYFGSFDHRLYAVDTKNGAQRWSYETKGPIGSSPAVDQYGTVYFGSADKAVHALYSDGTMKFVFTTGNMVDSSPVVSSTGVFIGSEDDSLYSLDWNGSERWSFNTSGAIHSWAVASLVLEPTTVRTLTTT